MINQVEFKEKLYPAFQAHGFAAKFAFAYATEVCSGIGFDIGANREEWKFPEAMAIDPAIDNRFDAMHLPDTIVDFIFSSHCLEHIPNWVAALDYWTTRIKSGGVLFLYLPAYSQSYWRPWSNRKHLHIFTPQIISDYMNDNGYVKVYASGIDLNDSFMVMGEKK